MAVAIRGSANQRRPIRDRLVTLGCGKIFAGCEDWSSRANCAHRGHVNMFGREGDQRTGGARVGIDKRISWDRGVIEDAGYFLSAIQSAAIRVHLENNCSCVAVFGRL